MEIAVIYFIILGVISGLTKGAGVLPDGRLHSAVGEPVMFTTTLNPPETPIGSVNMIFEEVSNVMATASSTDLVESSSSVRLSCSSSGSSLSFLWLNSSSEVTASDRVQFTDGGANLTIVNVTRYDQRPFRCHVSNPVSNGTSGPINFKISYGPENINLIISPSQEQYVEGSDISLSCSAVSRPSAQFQWFLNGDLQSDTGPELRLMNIQMSHSGNYSCRAFNNKTMRYEKSQPSIVSVVLERISGASITSSTNLPIEGESVNLTCDAAGSVFTRKWMKGGSDLIPAVNMNLHDNNRVLSFSSLNKKDSGEYSCEVSNPLSNDEASFTMVVYYGPENVQIRGPNELPLDETLTLTCSAESVPASYTWTLNGTEIHYSAIYTKNNIEPSDSGNYTCEVMNYFTWRTSSAVHGLTVTEEVSNVTATASSTDLVESSSSVRLSCSSSGSSLSFLWLNSSSEVTASDRVQFTDGGANLTIVNVTRYDQRPFRCHVSNPVSNGTSGPINFKISYGPENVQIRGPNEIHLKETLTLTCSAESVPASYTWTLNGKKIHYSAVYTKNNIEPSDSGNYTCEVMNYPTGRTSSAVHGLTVTDGSLSAGAIAGIVITCLVILSAVAGGGYYIHKKKIDNKAPPQSDNKEVEECVYENPSTYENTSTHENTTYDKHVN